MLNNREKTADLVDQAFGFEGVFRTNALRQPAPPKPGYQEIRLNSRAIEVLDALVLDEKAKSPNPENNSGVTTLGDQEDGTVLTHEDLLLIKVQEGDQSPENSVHYNCEVEEVPPRS